mmetsp:Transcript_26351/g.63531  ORF Transcript_26351/g.63531 Transcript_26351/m.63531 type:complete len:746 (-) Transcript_26351:225-2462(-)
MLEEPTQKNRADSKEILADIFSTLNKKNQPGTAPEAGSGQQRNKVPNVEEKVFTDLKKDADQRIRERERQLDEIERIKRDSYLSMPEMEKEVRRKRRAQPRQKPVLPKEVLVPDMMTLRDLSRWTKTSMGRINKILRTQLGMRRYEPSEYLDAETAEFVGVALDINVLVASKVSQADRLPTVPPADRSGLAPKPPVVCIMGHVNHGKTSLLDALRQSDIVAGEAGGITQSIGGFIVRSGGQALCFLDTPGHSIFHAMRSKGCRATDIAVILVSATDGVQEQTIESVRIAQENQVPMIVAINKCDVDGADIDGVKGQLMEQCGLVVEDLGGDVICQEISAKNGKGIEDLVETIQVVAEAEELRVDDRAPGEFIVIESKFHKGVGIQLNAIVRWGTLKVGDFFVCGKEFGRVRELADSDGKRIKKAGPSTPVMISGLRGEDCYGDEGLVVKNEKAAKQVVEFRSNQAAYESIFNARMEIQETRRKMLRSTMRKDKKEGSNQRGRPASPVHDVTIADIDATDYKTTIHLILRADCQGSLEAILDYISFIQQDDRVDVKVLKAGVGPPSQSDLDSAEISGGNSIILMFNTKASNAILKEAAKLKVPVTSHDVIYSLMDEIRDRVSELLPSVEKVKVMGSGDFLQVIKLNSGRQTIVAAGLKVKNGTLVRKAKWRVLRDNDEIFSCEEAESLRQFKDSVESVSKGDECGVILPGFEGYQLGDTLQCFEFEEEKAVFDDSRARRQQQLSQH